MFIKTECNTLVFNYIAQAPTPSSWNLAIPLKISPQNFFICESEILARALLQLLLAKSTGAGKVANDQAKL